MNLESMRVELDDSGVAHLTFTQGARGNPMDGTFCADLNEVATDLSERPGVRAVLVTAEGRAFSYGGDIAMFVERLDELPRMIKLWTTGLHTAISRLQRMDAPMVVAVHGVCAGGMAAFAAGCDMVVASADARFVAAYAGIGYSCDAGASITLSRRMGWSRAKRYLLFNETLNAEDALACGLVDEVTAADVVVDRATELARQMAAGPTLAFGEIRRLFLTVDNQPIESQLELEAQALARIAATPDAREGLTAFNDKRQAAFSGQRGRG